MKILALEFSSDHRGVAVLAGASPLAATEALDAGPRNTRAFGLIETALRQARLAPGEIECLAVGLGPGSYTGIRVAIAIAQGWQLARGVKLLGLSSVECLAAEAQAQGVRGRLALAIDAQRREFYLVAYDLGPDSVRELDALRLASFDEVHALAQAGQALAGPGLAKWFPAARDLHPSAGTLARLAAARADFVSGDRLEPIYLRPTAFVKAPPPRQLPAR